MITLQQQARALGDPTRHAIFRYLVHAESPVGIAELTDHFRLNHNAIRQHLAKLLAAELVTETTVRSGGPGRPRLVYVVDPAAESRWGIVGPYERLSLLLAEIIRTGDTPIAVGRRASEAYRASASAPDDAVATITEVMARLGFEPEVKRRGHASEIVLETCPFASVVLADRETVCSLHLGLAMGLAEGTDVSVTELVAKDPRRAHCRLRLQEGPEREDPPEVVFRR